MATYDFELGGTDGNAASTGNTGAMSGGISVGTGNAITLDDDAGVISGSMALKFHAGSTTAASYVEFAGLSGTPATENGVVFITLPPTGFDVDTTVFQRYNGANSSVVLRLIVTTANVLRLQDSGGAHTSTFIGDISSSLGSICAVRWTLDQATGAVKARFYDASAPLAAVGSYSGSEFSATGWSLGTGGFGKCRIGFNTAQSTLQAGGLDMWFDYLRYETGWNTWTAGPAATTAPTVDAGADQYGISGNPCTLTATGLIGTGGGAITGYSWTCTGLPYVGASLPTIVSPTAASTQVTGMVDGVYTFSVTATQSGGGGMTSAPDTVKAWWAPVSGAPVKPKSITKDPSISREGTVSDDAGALLDTSTSTGFRWPDNPTGEPFWITWNPAGPNDITFDLGAQLTADSSAGSVIATVIHYKEDGTTQIWPTAGGNTTTISTTDDTPLIAGLNAAAMASVGTLPQDRRELKTKITMSV